MDIQNQKYVLVQTKISPIADSRLERICKEYGFSSKYEILQYLISVFLKYADNEAEEQDVSEEGKLPLELAKMFEELQNKSHRINRASPGSTKLFVLTESIQLYQKAGRHGVIGTKYTFGKDGGFIKTESNSKILKSIISKLYPKMYKRIASLCVTLGGVGIDDAISYLLEETDHRLLPDSIEREVSKEFNQLSVAEKHVDMTGNKPKRTRTDNIEK